MLIRNGLVLGVAGIVGAWLLAGRKSGKKTDDGVNHPAPAFAGKGGHKDRPCIYAMPALKICAMLPSGGTRLIRRRMNLFLPVIPGPLTTSQGDDCRYRSEFGHLREQDETVPDWLC
jgi:hypothetical protein